MNAPVERQTLDEAIAAGREELAGKVYMKDMRGALVPLEVIKAQDVLMDETVRRIMYFATDLSDQVARFKQHTADDIYGHLELLAQEYGTIRGGAKGNVMLITHDGLMKILVRVQERVAFGPELQAAKALVDECLLDWTADAAAELRVVVAQSFQVDKQGQVSPGRMFSLLRYDIKDERWLEAMRAIRDSMRPIGSKEYFNFYRRETVTSPWVAVTIDLAAA